MTYFDSKTSARCYMLPADPPAPHPKSCTSGKTDLQVRVYGITIVTVICRKCGRLGRLIFRCEFTPHLSTTWQA